MPKRLAVALIATYQNYVRRAFPCACRFVPSCSEYTKQAIVRYGVIKGAVKGAKRILCCHPFSGKSGYDPVG